MKKKKPKAKAIKPEPVEEVLQQMDQAMALIIGLLVAWFVFILFTSLI